MCDCSLCLLVRRCVRRVLCAVPSAVLAAPVLLIPRRCLCRARACPLLLSSLRGAAGTERDSSTDAERTIVSFGRDAGKITTTARGHSGERSSTVDPHPRTCINAVRSSHKVLHRKNERAPSEPHCASVLAVFALRLLSRGVSSLC